MSDKEGALGVLNLVIAALNNGDDGVVLANMADNVVVVDDVAPFYRSGHSGVEQWLRAVTRSRSLLHASLSLQYPEVSEAGDRAYIVAPGVWKGSVPEENLDVDGLATATLVRRNGSWLVDALVWSSMT